jgi:tetratricopeptide (TPR) repeat protein
MNIKKIKYMILCVLLAAAVYSCGRKIVPAETIGKYGIKYDAAAFNYVFVEAIKQKLMGNGGDALNYLEQCTKISPESDAAYYQMAQIVLSNGDLNNAKKYALKAFSIDQHNLWYIMMLASMYYKDNNLDSAIIFYENAVKYYPEKEDLQLTLGNLYSEDKNFEKAESIYNSFDNKYGINEKSTISAVKNLIAEEKYEEALAKIKLLLKEYPDDILYNGVLAEIYRGMGDIEKALEVYEQLLERNPDNAQIQLSLCDFLIAQKNYDELFLLMNTVILNSNITKENKISLFARLLELPDLTSDAEDKMMISIMVMEANFTNDDLILLLRPELLIKENKLDEAASRLEEIIRVKPENYYAWEKLLLIYLQEGDYKNLMIRGEQCATRFNMSFTAKVLYANGALEGGKYDIALDELRKAEILAGDNKEYIIQVLTMRADAYYRMKEYVKAFETFEEALKTNKEDLTVINNYAYYLAEQNKNLKEAELMAKKVIDKEKANATFLDTYAWVLYKRGKNKEAARVMEEILKTGAKLSAVWYEHYGYILKELKKCDKAIETWNQALKIDSTKTELLKEIQNCKK